MKYISIFLSLLLVLICFTACVNNDVIKDNNSDNAENHTSEVASNRIENSLKEEYSDLENDVSVDNDSVKTTVKNDIEQTTMVSNTLIETTTEERNEKTADELAEELKNSDVVTYYSDNPDNKYICAVSEKYKVDKSCLVALIRTQANRPGATVLQFSGKTDSEGKLVFNKNELKYIYEINDTDGIITKASRNSSENDGCSSGESKAAFFLIENFIVDKLNNSHDSKVYTE